jgi:Nucleotidyl transferase AbiEii toxin, Type IV TA system
LATAEKFTAKKHSMTAKQFYDWQTSGGTDDVMRLVACLESADIPWCAIGGVAVNHWAEEPMVTQDVDFVVAAENVDRAIQTLEQAGFKAERHAWSVNFTGRSKVSIQLSTEEVYLGFPARSVPADVHGILLRVASLEDTLTGKILAWRDGTRRQSKRIKDFADIARLVESHPALWEGLPEELKAQVERPGEI